MPNKSRFLFLLNTSMVKQIFDLYSSNLISVIKLLLINGFPFGLLTFYILNTKNKNKFLILISILYLIVFF